jgi:phosphopantothenoylcysteine decarboxylase/phosphopantothenate--cysteine ligase
VALETPAGVERVDVVDVAGMLAALQQATAESDAVIMSAAPADFRPAHAAEHKIKKSGDGGITVELTKNPDIIATLPGGGVRVGFAAETQNIEAYAREKLAAKRLDFIVANDVSAPGSGFGTETNEVIIFHRSGEAEHFPLLDKYAVGNLILDRVKAQLPS